MSANKKNYQVNVEELADIKNVKIDNSLGFHQRVNDFKKQVKNPYRYKCNGVVVNTRFKGECTLEESLKQYFIRNQTKL